VEFFGKMLDKSPVRSAPLLRALELAERPKYHARPLVLTRLIAYDFGDTLAGWTFIFKFFITRTRKAGIIGILV